MKLKKILAVVLALVMVLALAACSKSESNTIKIGSIGPLTGDAAQYGTAVKLGAELAVKEINAAGGINGYQIEFRMEDDVCDAEKSVSAYGTLKNWGMQMLMGAVTSTCCKAVSTKAETDKMFLLTPSGSSVDCIKPANAFRVCFSDPNQGIAAANYIAENKLGTKIAVIYNSSDSYSTGIKDAFVKEAAEKGLEVVAQEAFTNDNATDFSAQITNIKAKGAELVLLPIYYTPASLIMKQAKDAGYSPKFVGCDGMDGILGMENIDTSLVEGLIYLTPFVAKSSNEAATKFANSFKEAYPDQTQYLNQFAADAYDAIYIIKAAAEKAGIKPDMDIAAVGDAMTAAMLDSTFTFNGVTDTGITWSAEGEPTKTPRVAKIVNGEAVALNDKAEDVTGGAEPVSDVAEAGTGVAEAGIVEAETA